MVNSGQTMAIRTRGGPDLFDNADVFMALGVGW